MTEPKTKREAEERAAALGAERDYWLQFPVETHDSLWGASRRMFVARCSAEAARLRALLPTLPEEP